MLTHSRTDSIFIELKIGGLAAYTFIPIDQTLTLLFLGRFLCLTWSEEKLCRPTLRELPETLSRSQSQRWGYGGGSLACPAARPGTSSSYRPWPNVRAGDEDTDPQWAPLLRDRLKEISCLTWG